ncbi:MULTISPECIES: hypothetical protein [Rhizobium]|uniref:hypothetical protein n=1 Tax=Rhizobium TaxID=379 RepID=UPI0007E949D4|nr:MULTISPECIES: hypothetical protein [Rhizobium]ANL02203.1 hypothetical protein AMJ99_CH00608 [Rhizobium esperanzae]ANL08331.1 hypothetical protein AMJ98_CH00608 [Rhizobium sp. N1341]ANM33054.1 hypothetical protein AMK04_CH00608 [Rhizobium sp. N871]ANM39172.1 hypothetical protein AMK03_CH00608 [Rhizobium sp. N741]
MSSKRPPRAEDIIAWLQHGIALLEAAGIAIPRDRILRPERPRIERPLNSEQKRIRDDVDRFIAASLDDVPGAPPLQAQRIYEAYRRYAEKAALEAVSQTAFGRALARRLRKEKLGDRIYYFDVQLRDEPGLPL